MKSLADRKPYYSYSIGLDVGVASIGWAVIEEPQPNRPAALIRSGVHAFDEGVEGDIESGRDEARPASKTVRETEAEAVVFVVCQAIGLEAGTAASDYIQLFDGKTETLAQSLDRIQHVAAEIIAALHDAPDEQAQAA